MVEVFKTNVHEASQAKKMVALLVRHFPGSKINFDLDDCDKVLKIAGENFMSEKVMMLVKANGFECKILL